MLATQAFFGDCFEGVTLELPSHKHRYLNKLVVILILSSGKVIKPNYQLKPTPALKALMLSEIAPPMDTLVFCVGAI